eukprot:gene27928-16211_t
MTHRALFDYVSLDPDDLHFKANDFITVTDFGEPGNPQSWWEGSLRGKHGSFPGHFVAELSQHVLTLSSAIARLLKSLNVSAAPHWDRKSAEPPAATIGSYGGHTCSTTAEIELGNDGSEWHTTTYYFTARRF